METIKVLELFSGIGGMHFALKASGISSEVVAAVDINNIANDVYSHNFPETKVLNRNIQFLNEQFMEKHKINAILMSPPCQPFTRTGKQLDNADARTDGLLHVCDLIPKVTTCLKWILMENVKGFESSKSRDVFVESLTSAGFNFQEFLLTPSSFGVPNSRMRYYCIARKNIFEFSQPVVMETIPGMPKFDNPREISGYLDEDSLELPVSLVPEDVVNKHSSIMDIVHANSTGSTCFTKAYTRYIEGTGSVFTEFSKAEVDVIFASKETDDFRSKLRSLNLRFFTPKEVSRLMCFPEDFNFPSGTSEKQKYRLLGNSLNVLVVKELLTLLFRNE